MPRRAPNIVRKWKRVCAIGCTHGDLIHPGIRNQVLKFVSVFKPDIRFDLGDLVDTAAFRAGAHNGAPDESRAVEPDLLEGQRWIQDYRPTHIAWGNHDWRLVEWTKSANAKISFAAGVVWGKLQESAAKVKAETRPYDLNDNWFHLGGVYWGHGFWFNEAAVRDHAEFLGGRVVMAHLHRPLQERGRTRFNSSSFCVGTMMDVAQADYARRRRSTSRWGHGVVFGELCDDEAALWLAETEPGGTLRFPFPL